MTISEFSSSEWTAEELEMIANILNSIDSNSDS